MTGGVGRPSVRLAADTAWTMLRDAHTGILVTLRRDGVPIALPVWFAAIDRQIWMTTPRQAKKAARARRDARASFLIEGGERWDELVGVHLTGRISSFDTLDDQRRAQFDAEMDRKYLEFRTPRAAMPEPTREHYTTPFVYLCFTPDERMLTWNNAQLGLS